MKIEELKYILSKIGVDGDRVSVFSPTQVQIACPLSPWLHKNAIDSHPSLSIRYSVAGKWTVFKCWACKTQGKIWQLVDQYATLKEDKELQSYALSLMYEDKPLLSSMLEAISEDLEEWVRPPKLKRAKRFNPDLLDRFVPAFESLPARAYLEFRQVTPDDADKYGLLYDKKQERVLIPVWYDGELQGMVGRLIHEGSPRYYNYLGMDAGLTLGGIEHVKDRHNHVCVLEGFFDILRCHKWADENNAGVVCTWRAEITEVQAELILGLDKGVSFWYDNDDAGNTGWLKAKEILGREMFGLKRASIPIDSDVGEMGQLDWVSRFNALRST